MAASPGVLNSTRLRLEYLDGLRGLAALYVAVAHASSEALGLKGDGTLLSRLFLGGIHLMPYARFAVAVFIVLSGYCLMLPVVRSADGQLQGGTSGYLWRRARRILPPYYAALIFSLLAIAALYRWGDTTNPAIQTLLPAFAPDVLLSHIFLVHNLNPDWIFKINGPMWSVATEFQIYFIFPLALLPVWRRYGIGAAVLTGLLIGNLPHWLFQKRLDVAIPWYVGLFAMGMAGADIGFSTKTHLQVIRRRHPWGLYALALFGLFVALFLYRPSTDSYPLWLTDPLVGLATACLLIYCTRHLTDGVSEPKPLALRFLDSRPVVWLGTFSYSLYLIHTPIFLLFGLLYRGLGLEIEARLALTFLFMLPTTLLCSYGFYWVFERPFLSSRRKARG